jgi:methylthioribose-1-phosphate isomerase
VISPLKWNEQSGTVALLDQTRLPMDEVWLEIATPEAMAEAIRTMQVRGAPAIGIAASYGAVLALKEPVSDPARHVLEVIDMLAETRPTAVNLFHSLDRMRNVAREFEDADADTLRSALLEEAEAIEREDRDAGVLLGEHGLSLFHDGMCVMTHCHTGGVATSGYGTALAPLILSKQRGVDLRAFVGETRPLLQGSRITAWELQRSGIPATLITDSTAAHVMAEGKVDAVIVGADRVAANGDFANKIGTYGLAVLAHAHSIPFYVSVPTSTIDLDVPDGKSIVIEERDPSEVTNGFGRRTAPEGVDVYNPAFDVTPGRYVWAFITERGILRPPYQESLLSCVSMEAAG